MTLGIRRDPAHPWAKFCPFRWPGTKSRRYIDDFFLRGEGEWENESERERDRAGERRRARYEAAKERRKEEKGRKDERGRRRKRTRAQPPIVAERSANVDKMCFAVRL